MTQMPLFDIDDYADNTTTVETTIVGGKVVLLLGNLTQEGVTSKIHSFGYRYEQRLLQSTWRNWLKIEEFITKFGDNDRIITIFTHLYEPVLLYFGIPEYRAIWTRLLTLIKKYRGLIFVYEDNLFGKFTELETLDQRFRDQYDWYILSGMADTAEQKKEAYTEHRTELLNQINWANKMIEQIHKSGIEIAPYKKNAEITIRIHDYLDEIDSGMFLRLYVPNGRYQAEQFDRLLGMFESYLRNVEKRSFFIETRKTTHGVVYVFKSKDELAVIRELDEAMTRFEDFMRMCQNDTAQAERALTAMGVAQHEANQLVTKYRVNYQRITVDIMRERETKLVSLKYELQSDILELVNNQVISSSQIVNPSSMLSIINPASVIINIADNKIAQSIIEQQINGDVHYNEHDKELIKLFFEHNERLEATRLKSELDQLKDENTPRETKLTARQRIVNFLARLGEIASEGAVKILVAYLEKFIGAP